MNNLQQIEQAVSVMQKRGYIITQGVMFDQAKRICCPIGAVLYMKSSFMLDDHYSPAFMASFDGGQHPGLTVSEKYRQGHEDGKICRGKYIASQRI